MTRHTLFLATLLTTTILLAISASAFCQTSESSPKFAGKALPNPPQQDATWTAPKDSGLPDRFIAAAQALFAAGMADPRGCEYREVSIAIGSCWSGDSGVRATHGWVLPEDGASGHQRFTVAWNGWVYPMVRVGQKCDLTAAVERFIANDEARETEQRKRGPKAFVGRFGGIDETSYTSEKLIQQLKVVLLLRLGESALAQRAFDRWHGMDSSKDRSKVVQEDPFLSLAEDWLWAGFDRAICAHMRGDDALARLTAIRLQSGQKVLLEELKKHGSADNNRRLNDREPFGFLGSLPKVMADQQRRAERTTKPLSLDQARKISDKAQRIKALIALLDEVSARQMGQPGGVSLGSDSIVQALVTEGEAAVEPLIECLEHDERLTRSVHFWRDFHRSRSPLAVHEAAYVALANILQKDFFSPQSTGDDLSARESDTRKRLANSIREYWAKRGRIPLVERWYVTLQDDKAPIGDWLEAASLIVQEADVEVTRGSQFFGSWTRIPDRNKGRTPPLRGEPLRSKKDPSVTELLLRRTRDLIKRNRADEPTTEAALQLVLVLTRWDGRACQKEIAEFNQQLAAQTKPSDDRFNASESLAGLFKLCARRIETGDSAASKDYAVLLRRITPREAGGINLRQVLEPLWKYPNDAVLAEVADELFNGKDSIWNPLMEPREGGMSYHARVLLHGPLINLPAFQKQVLRMLDDRREIGNVRVSGTASLEIEVKQGWNSVSSMMNLTDPLAPKPKASVSFRMCDLYGSALGDILGFPRLELYWPEPQRNVAVERLQTVLRQYGRHLRYTLEPRVAYNPMRCTIIMFNSLAVPATMADVEAGRAIFTLADEGKVRQCKLSDFPTPARWTKYQGAPRTRFSSEGKVSTIYVQNGLIWQAEEVFRDGSWHRYYGFVGPGCMAKVPAAEVEFLK